MPNWTADPRTILGDAQLSRMPPGAQLLYMKLRLWGDSERRCYADPTTIKGTLFPHDDTVTEDAIIQWLTLLERKRYIRFYHHDGDDYLVWHRHVVTMGRKPKPELPDPPAGYYEGRHRPAFMQMELPLDEQDHAPEDQWPFPDEPIAPPAGDNTCCVLSMAGDFGLTSHNARAVLEPYCDMRRRQNTCLEPGDCREDISLVVRKVRANKPRNYASYLMKALQEDLPRVADACQQQRARQARRRPQ